MVAKRTKRPPMIAAFTPTDMGRFFGRAVVGGFLAGLLGLGDLLITNARLRGSCSWI